MEDQPCGMSTKRGSITQFSAFKENVSECEMIERRLTFGNSPVRKSSVGQIGKQADQSIRSSLQTTRKRIQLSPDRDKTIRMFDNPIDSPNSMNRVLLREIYDEGVDSKVVKILKNLSQTI